MPVKFNVGDVVKMRKAHPCGSALWQITRTGIDFCIKSRECGHFVLLPRVKFERMVKEVVAPAGE